MFIFIIIMEAITAVGFAGNIVQFVDFVANVISAADAIRKRGRPHSLSNLRKWTATLKDLAWELKTDLEASGDTLCEQNQPALDVFTDFYSSAQNFLAYLDSLIAEDAAKNVLRSIKASIKLQFAQPTIDDYIDHLGRLQNLAHFFVAKQTNTPNSTGTILAKREIPQNWAILTRLSFLKMTCRFDEVSDAFPKTFQWIFEPPESAPWDDLTCYLTAKDTNTPYFVNGKAGSGKSVLMKFIRNHCNTMKALKCWAGEDEVVFVDFFFSSLGTPSEKSQTGMLRALLYSILKSHQELIPDVFQTMFHHWKASYADTEFTLIEVKKAFNLLLEKCSNLFRLCILIDGVNECEDNPKDIAEYLRSLASPRVKVLLSSQPLGPFPHVFRGCPTLKLQDLTKDDMDIFIKENLTQHESMIELRRKFPRESRELVSNISTKAKGVFLWVKIVVGMLIEGLEDGDNMEELQRKLHQLPPDLEDLFGRMLDRIPRTELVEAAKLFLTFDLWNSTLSDHQPPWTITLSVSLDDPCEASERQISRMKLDELRSRCHIMENRLRSRCCGLIEVHKRPGSGIRDREGDATVEHMRVSEVTYMHQTVAEYFRSSEVSERFRKLVKDANYSPGEQLASGCLSMMKIATDFEDPLTLVCIRNTLDIGGKAYFLSDQKLEAYGKAIDQTMNHYRTLKEGCESTIHWMKYFYPVTGRIPFDPLTFDEHKFYQAGSIFSFAARAGAFEYLKAWRTFPDICELSRYTLVVHALKSWLDEPQLASLQSRLGILSLLFGNVAQLEDEGFGGSLWQCVLEVCCRLQKQSKEEDGGRLLKAALSATPSACTLMEKPVRNCDGVIRDPKSIYRALIGREYQIPANF